MNNTVDSAVDGNRKILVSHAESLKFLPDGK